MKLIPKPQAHIMQTVPKPIPSVNGQRLLQELDTLAQIGHDADGGVTRLAYSPADREGRAWVQAQMRELGLTIRTDAAGNTIGLYPGQEPLPPLALGSHTDTVPNGGRYDGALGVLGALVCVRALYEAGLRLRHPVEVINFAAEEATMSEGTLGSQAMAGLLKPRLIHQLAWDGRPVSTHLSEAGLDPAEIGEAHRPTGSLTAYLELHIEQGGMLEAANIPLGVVEGIVGIRRYVAGFQGFANHAGTTPMAGRRDALVLAAPFITQVRDVAVRRGIVGTVGSLRVQPGAPNVIPGYVELDVETRSLRENELDEVEAELAELAAAAGAEWRQVGRKPPVESDPRLLAALGAACEELGLPYRRMPSGAGHDAMCMAAIAPQALLFTPSRGGISHSPQEFTEPEACLNGARVLLAALLKLDEL
ncbi:MAG: Zn-dependent hydrolase [Anaerolineae bacterium]